MKKFNKLFALLLITLILVSCKCFKSKSNETMPTLENTTWKLIKTDSKVFVENNENPEGIQISFMEGNFSTSNGCNANGGTFKTDGNQIEFGQIRATMRYCDKEYMEKYGYPVSFHQVKKYKIENNKLYLLDEEEKIVFAEYIK